MWTEQLIIKLARLNTNIMHFTLRGGMTLAGHQMPTEPASPSPFSAGQGEKYSTKGSWVKTQTGRSLSSYHHGQNRRDLGKLIYYQSKSE